MSNELKFGHVWSCRTALLGSSELDELLSHGWEPLTALPGVDGPEVFLRKQTIAKPFDERVITCTKCGGSAVWLETSRGKRCMVDPTTVEEDDTLYDPSRHTCHWESCQRMSRAELQERHLLQREHGSTEDAAAGLPF